MVKISITVDDEQVDFESKGEHISWKYIIFKCFELLRAMGYVISKDISDEFDYLED